MELSQEQKLDGGGGVADADHVPFSEQEELKALKCVWVKWNFGWANSPELAIEIPVKDVFDKIRDELVHEIKEDGDSGRFAVAEHESGLVDYLYESYSDHNGYAGRSFTLKTEFEEVVFEGPWSSNSMSVMVHTGQLSYECSIGVAGGITRYSGAIAISIAVNELREILENIKAQEKVSYTEMQQGKAPDDREFLQKWGTQELCKILKEIDDRMFSWIEKNNPKPEGEPMEPSEKSPEMTEACDSFASSLFGRTRTGSIGEQKCVSCGGYATEFRNELSKREYKISGLCQKCQDAVFGTGDEDVSNNDA